MNGVNYEDEDGVNYSENYQDNKAEKDETKEKVTLTLDESNLSSICILSEDDSTFTNLTESNSSTRLYEDDSAVSSGPVAVGSPPPQSTTTDDTVPPVIWLFDSKDEEDQNKD